ncbi:hypothetical protein ACQKML_01975 [Peribacillus frigoritolerans]
MNFMKSIYVIKEAVLAIASFFCPKKVPFALTLIGNIHYQGIHMTAITHVGLAVN